MVASSYITPKAVKGRPSEISGGAGRWVSSLTLVTAYLPR